MIAFIKGKIIYIENDYIIVENNGIGFSVYYFPNSKLKLGKVISLYITHKFSDFGEFLFGFDSIQEKKIFDFLVNLKVIGPRTIFLIMNRLFIKDIADLERITMDDLLKVNGVGSNIASKFLLALNNKLKKNKLLDVNIKTNKFISNKYEDVINALVNLGFKKENILKFVEVNIENIANLANEEEIIKYILKNIRNDL